MARLLVVQRILANHGYAKTTICTPENLPDQKLWKNEVLREVYAARDAYAAEHGYDLDRIYADLKQREAKSRLRRVDGGRTLQTS